MQQNGVIAAVFLFMNLFQLPRASLPYHNSCLACLCALLAQTVEGLIDDAADTFEAAIDPAE